MTSGAPSRMVLVVNARGTMGDAPCVSGFCEDFEDAPGRPRGASTGNVRMSVSFAKHFFGTSCYLFLF